MKFPPYPPWGMVCGVAAGFAVGAIGYALSQHFHRPTISAVTLGLAMIVANTVGRMECFKPPDQRDR
jgi:hypothetical protein